MGSIIGKVSTSYIFKRSRDNNHGDYYDSGPLSLSRATEPKIFSRSRKTTELLWLAASEAKKSCIAINPRKC